MENKDMPLDFTPEDYRVAELLHKLPRPCFTALERLVGYMDTPFLEEIFLPETALDRLYELMILWIDGQLYELFFLTAMRVFKQSGTFDRKKFQVADERQRNREGEQQAQPRKEKED